MTNPQAALPLCLTPGDPTGIGPEVTVKFLANHVESGQTVPIAVIGDIGALREQARQCRRTLPEHESITYQDIDESKPGAVAYQALLQAVELISRNKAKALVTGPISKHHLHLAGIPYNGHTEILQDLANQYFPSSHPYQSDMLFVHEQFRMLLLTRHVALQEVSRHLKPETIEQSLDSLIHFLRARQGIAKPRLGILGVNPHAGEMQLKQDFCEERDILIPVLDKLSERHQLAIDPPLAADAAFRGFNPKAPTYDCYVAAYHDQGLIPMKLVAGMQAVNVTIGLPFLRTSVSHGTAPDIAGKGIADASALESAFHLAHKLTSHFAKPFGPEEKTDAH